MHIQTDSFESNKIASLLEQIDIRNEPLDIQPSLSKIQNKAEVTQVYKDLEGQNDQISRLASLSLIFCFELNAYVLYEPNFFFNKYRLITLRSDLYGQMNIHFDLLKYKSYCRSKEQRALKAGLAKQIWSDPTAKGLFGASEEAGYFGGNGSNGWKLIALTNFALDVFMHEQGLRLVRLSPYDTLMINGRLLSLKDVLISNDLNVNEKVQQFLKRQLFT